MSSTSVSADHPLRHCGIQFHLTHKSSGQTHDIPIEILLRGNSISFRDGEFQFTIDSLRDHLMDVARRNSEKEMSMFRFFNGYNWKLSFLLYLFLFRFNKAFESNADRIENRDALIGVIRDALNRDFSTAYAYGACYMRSEASTTTVHYGAAQFNVSIVLERDNVGLALERLLCHVDERSNVGPFGEDRLTELATMLEPELGLTRNPLTSPPYSKIDNMWRFICWLNPQQ